MSLPTIITKLYELHYVLKGVKKLVLIEKSNMCELDAWLCVVMIVKADLENSSTNFKKDLSQAVARAFELGIHSVRWNQSTSFSTLRPSIFIYGDRQAEGLFIKTGDIQMDRYRNNMP